MVSTSSTFSVVVVVLFLVVTTVAAGDLYRTNVLYPGQQLRRFDELSAPGGYTFGLDGQTDCSFCFRKNRIIDWCFGWASGKGVDCSFTLQRNGQLVINGDSDNAVYTVNNAERGRDFVLLLQDDGHIALYGAPVWTSREWPPLIISSSTLPLMLSTQQREPALPAHATTRKAQRPSNSRHDQNVLYEGEHLIANQELRTKSYRLVMQADCNLVLYSAFKIIWQTYTPGSGTNCKLELRRWGNLVVTNNSGDRVWSSGPPGDNGDYILILQDDGNLFIYSRKFWARPGDRINEKGVVMNGNHND